MTPCRFSPNFSKRCTHLIVSSEQSDASQLKVYLASINKAKWHAHAVRFEWLMECATQHRQVAEDNFAVLPPRHEVSHVSIQHTVYVHMHNRSDSRMPFVLQDVGLIQQRLQEVATPTLAEGALGYAPSEVGTLLGASKASARQGHLSELRDCMAAKITLVTSLQRCALETEVHSNITTRSAPKQASKRHKHADSQLQQQQPESGTKPQEASVTAKQAPFAPSLYQTDLPARPVLGPSSTSHAAQQPASLRWPRPLCKPPTAVLPAGRDKGRMPLQGAPSQADGPGSISSTNPLVSSLRHAQTQKYPAPKIQQGNSSGTTSRGPQDADASNLACRLHAMQADAMDRAWQRQHESQRVPNLVSNSASAAPMLLSQEPQPPGSVSQVPVTDAFGHSGTVMRQPRCGIGQQAASLTSNSRSEIDPSKAAVQSAGPSLATAAQADARSQATCKPAPDPTKSASRRNTDPMPTENRGPDLSTDTETLVAKLRALSQGRKDSAQSKVSSQHPGQQQQQQRYPFASRATNCNQAKPSMAEPTKAPPLAKRSKQAGMHTAVVTSAAGHAAAAASCHLSPSTARCIQLVEPVHSGTEYGSGSSPKRLQPQAGTPVASNSPRSAYASVAAPIPLGAPAQQLPVAALLSSPPGPTATAAASAASGRVHQQAPASPVQHRLGKPTPLKKGFTPKPTRFRLEAERLSITPPDKSSGLEKVLFRSPAKAAAAASPGAEGRSFEAVPIASPGSEGCSNKAVPSATCFPAATSQPGLMMTLPESAQQAHAGQSVPDACSQQVAVSHSCSEQVAPQGGSQAMVTPANGCISGMQADPPALPPGVFADMKAILDPELSSEESHRYI